MHAKSLQSCLTLSDPMDGSPPGSSVHRILQVRILEWVSGLPCPPPGDLPDPGIQSISTATLALQADSLPLKPRNVYLRYFIYFIPPSKYLILIRSELLSLFHFKDISFIFPYPEQLKFFLTYIRLQTVSRKRPSNAVECSSNLFPLENQCILNTRKDLLYLSAMVS